jgi:hypothetical protein
MTLSVSPVENVVTKVPDRRSIRALRIESEVPVRQPSDTAEIERVTALLRSVQPDLEVWGEGTAAHRDDRPSPVWLTIGAVWVSAILLIGMAVTGIVLLVG